MEEVAEDLLCIGCGYNLRHARVEGRCPECGVDVATSIQGDQLYRAAPQWLERIRGGLFGIAAGSAILVVTVLVCLPLPDQLAERIVYFGFFAFTAMTAWGAWRLFTPEKKRGLMEFVARGASALLFLGGTAEAMTSLVRVFGGWSFREPNWIGSIWALSWVAIEMMVFRRCRDLTRRAFAPSLRCQCAMLAWLQIPAFVLGILAGIDNLPISEESIIFLRVSSLVLPCLDLSYGNVLVWLVRRQVGQAMKLKRKTGGQQSADRTAINLYLS